MNDFELFKKDLSVYYSIQRGIKRIEEFPFKYEPSEEECLNFRQGVLPKKPSLDYWKQLREYESKMAGFTFGDIENFDFCDFLVKYKIKCHVIQTLGAGKFDVKANNYYIEIKNGVCLNSSFFIVSKPEFDFCDYFVKLEQNENLKFIPIGYIDKKKLNEKKFYKYGKICCPLKEFKPVNELIDILQEKNRLEDYM